MLIIFDQATPLPKRQYLELHTVQTAAQLLQLHIHPVIEAVNTASPASFVEIDIPE